MLVRLLLALTVIMMSGCVSGPPPKNYAAFRAENPRSILVVPALNNTVSVNAADYFHSTVSRPFAERGYYVFPAHMVKTVLERDGLSDAGLVHQADPRRLGALFGCDVVLYISIEKWESQYALIVTSTNVAFNYSIKSCKTGAELWSDKRAMSYSPQQNSSGNPLADLIAMAIVAAAEKAAPNYIPLAQQANFAASTLIGTGVPNGPYRPKFYNKDYKEFPSR